jgi:hypothetical protein
MIKCVLNYEEFLESQNPVDILNQEISSNIDIEEFNKTKIDSDDYEIAKIVAISTVMPDDMTNKIDLTNENYIDATPLTTDLSLKSVAKGDTLYITAVLYPKTTAAYYKPGKLGVLKVRVMDLYYDLNQLKYNTQYKNSTKPSKTKKS